MRHPHGGCSSDATNRHVCGGEIPQKDVEIAPRSSAEVARYTRSVENEPPLSEAAKLELLKKKIKYVFVLFQENRSFDFYFGTYPGARGLFSQPASETPGFVQPLVDTDGDVVSISPFLIPQTTTNSSSQTVQLYPEDTDSVNHGHTAIDAKLDLDATHVARNDRYAFVERSEERRVGKECRSRWSPYH